MAKLIANTHVRHPETGELAFLLAGGDVPDWASSLIGEHLVEGGAARGRKPAMPKAPVEDPVDEMVRLQERINELKATELLALPLRFVAGVQPPEEGSVQDGPPPKGGAGSGAPAWREYAAKRQVAVAEGASREDVWAALEAAGIPTE